MGLRATLNLILCEDYLIVKLKYLSTAAQCVNLGGHGGYEYADHVRAEDKHANTWIRRQSSTGGPTDNTLEI